MRKSVLASVSLVAALAGVATVGAAVEAQTPTHSTVHSTQQSHPAAKAKKLVISMFAFSPGTLTVKPGQKIKVINKDAFAHTVTSDDATSFDIPVPLKSTVTFKAPTTPGTYDFHCSIHITMHGVLVVKG